MKEVVYQFTKWLVIPLLLAFSIVHINIHISIPDYLDVRFSTQQLPNNIEIKSDDVPTVTYSNQKIAIVDGHGDNAAFTFMKHIREMFEHMGYQIKTAKDLEIDDRWDVMWYHEYSYHHEPYRTLIKKSNRHQIINHIPGSGYYTSKVALATCGLTSGVPEAFQLPQQKAKLLSYSAEHPDVLWVQKDNTHRNIKIKKLDEMDLSKNNSFVQKFVDNPLLIDNRKFDIGIYTVVTSILPLRVYIYDGDVLIRFCPEDYHPFDVTNVDKYVVGDDYTPIWEIESLGKYFNIQQMGFKHTIDSYLGTKNQDSSRIWSQIYGIIAEVFQSQQSKMLFAWKSVEHKAKHFELSRFDFVVDDQLNVFLMEANMSPNLSSGHFKQNQIMYEKVLMSIFSLTGISQQLTEKAAKDFNSRSSDQNPIVNDRDINLPLKYCVENGCESCDEAMECQLCGHCMSPETGKFLQNTFLEHVNRRQMKRIEFDYLNRTPLTKEDHLLALWLKTKCILDHSWC